MAAPVFELVADFRPPPASPVAPMVAGANGEFWGTTGAGGVRNLGTVYKLNGSTGEVSVIYEFTAPGDVDGTVSPLVYDGAGYFWGTSIGGGTDRAGSIFKIRESTGEFSRVYEFRYGPSIFADGARPWGGLVRDTGGDLWGTTSQGGTGGFGTLFRFNPVTGVLTTGVHFTGEGSEKNGGGPYGELAADGKDFLWGRTRGTLFKLNTVTGQLHTVSRFPDIGSPGQRSNFVYDGLGHMWGTDFHQTTDTQGNVYKIDIDTGELVVVRDIHEGGPASSGLMKDDAGLLWGTQRGDTGAEPFLYSINPATGAFHRAALLNQLGLDVSLGGPHQALTNGGGGTFWGILSAGTEYSQFYKFSKASGQVSVVAQNSIPAGFSHGFHPSCGLTDDGAGYLWGSSFSGGRWWFGTLFKVEVSTGKMFHVWDFIGGAVYAGGNPYGSLWRDSGGNFWGTTDDTVFRFNRIAGTVSLVKQFDWIGESGFPGGFLSPGLEDDGAGFLWGNTQTGYTFSGTIFKINKSNGAATNVHVFPEDRSGPVITPTALTSDGTGFLWGEDEYGGAAEMGGIFKVNRSTGALTRVMDFSGPDGVENRGAHPQGGFVKDNSGNLWGTTTGGGGVDRGTVFKLNPVTGAVTTVVEFGSGGTMTGANPVAGMIKDSAGNLWGLTPKGGKNGYGAVFRIQPDTGVAKTVLDFPGDSSQSFAGAGPKGSLTKASDGNLYGTAYAGGPMNRGTVFRIRLGPTPLALAPGRITKTTAVLNGTLNPNGAVTTATFEYGVTTAYGMRADALIANTSGTTAAPVSARLTGLSAGRVYHFRLTAVNAEGTEYSADGFFTTAPLSGPPSPVTVQLSSSNSNPAWANATDTLTLSFSVEESVAPPVVTILGQPIPPVGGPLQWTAQLSAALASADGPAAFSILLTKAGGGPSATYSSITEGGAVTVDITPPLVPAAVDVVVRPAARTGMRVSFPAIQAVDATSGVGGISHDPPSGSLFPYGVASVTRRIMDVAGNTTSQIFRVVVSVLPGEGKIEGLARNSGGQPVLSLAGVPGFGYAIERSDRLDGGWTVLERTAGPDSEVFSFTDESPLEARAFYRLRREP